MNKMQDNLNIEDEININFFLKFILRNKILITLFLIFGTLFGFIYSNSLPKKWKGSFQIVVNDLNNQINNSEIFSRLPGFSLGQNKELMTEKSILKSPSVLMPVFDFVKNNSSNDPYISEKTTFQNWVDSSLDVSFKENTTVLKITYKSNNKELIDDVLKLISEKYKEYSISDKERNISKSIIYLTNQEKIYSKKAKESLKNLNQFSIKNGLGDIDGFGYLNRIEDLTTNTISLENISGSNPNLYSDDKIKPIYDTGRRFSKQFAMLEEYESRYLDLSSKLKPNSQLLTNLKLKIDNLKESLKRPNEILLNYRELVKLASRDEIILSTIQQNLNILKLEKAKTRDSWQLISNPYIQERYFYPSVLKINILYAVFSFFVGTLVSFIIEKKTGLIYELQNLKKSIKTNYLNELYIDDLELSKKLIDKNFKYFDNKNANLKFGILLISDDQSNNIFKKSSLFLEKPKYLFFDINNIDKLEDTDKYLIILKVGKVTRNQIDKLNIFLDLYKDKVIGWSSLSKLNFE